MSILKNNSGSGLSAATLCERFPWFGAARCEAARSGVATAESYLIAGKWRSRRSPALAILKEISSEEFERSETLGIIDAFIRSGENHKIVIDESTPDEAFVPTELADEDDEVEFISEDLAEIYAKQHLFDQAIEIYQKLSLQIPQKSIYFAELIEQLNAEKNLTEK